MIDKPPLRFSLIGFIFVGAAGFGLAYGFVRSFHLSWYEAVACIAFLLLIQWMIYKSGKAASYANAQAWAQSQATAAANASAKSVAQALALSEAAATAIASANASAIASNSVVLQLAALPTAELVYEQVKKLASTGFEEGIEGILEGLPAREQLTESRS